MQPEPKPDDDIRPRPVTPTPAPYPVARAWLEEVRVAAGRVEPLQRELSALLDARDQLTSWSTGGGGGSKPVYSDPTASAAMRRMGELAPLIADAQARLDAALSTVGEAGDVLKWMRSALGGKHADALERYYIDRAPTWSAVAWDMHVSVTTCWRLRCDAYAWMEEHCRALLA